MNRQVVSLASKMPSKLAIIANRVKFSHRDKSLKLFIFKQKQIKFIKNLSDADVARLRSCFASVGVFIIFTVKVATARVQK